MYQKTRGIVLHAIKYSETSVIARIYTEKFGLLSFIVKGVRSAKSKAKASLLQPMSILDMEFQYRENKGLQFIKEFKRHYTYQSLPFDVIKSSVGLFILEVVSKTIHEHEPNAEAFELAVDAFIVLDKQPLHPDFHLLFLLQYARPLGFIPHLNFSENTPYFEMREGVFISSYTPSTTILSKEDSRQIARLMNVSLFEMPNNKLNRESRKHLLQCLLKYYSLHVENFQLKSPEVLETILG